MKSSFSLILAILTLSQTVMGQGNGNGNGNGNGGEGSNRVAICHGTASETNPYVLIFVDDNAANNNPGSLGGHINNPQHNDPNKPKNPDVLIGEEPPRFPGCITDDQCRVCCNGECIGDPHFQLWNGDWYDFHGQCDLVFLQNPEFAQGLGMDIHIRTTIRDWFSFIETVAIRIGNDVLEISGWGEHLFNGVHMAPLPVQMAGRYNVTHTTDPAKPKVDFF